MNGAPRRSPGTDMVLLLEAGLVVLLLVLFLLLYVVPTQTRLRGVPWWSPVVLGALSLGILLLDAWRRKRRSRQEMKKMMEEHLGEGPPG
jgi:hypothetical protein